MKSVAIRRLEAQGFSLQGEEEKEKEKEHYVKSAAARRFLLKVPLLQREEEQLWSMKTKKEKREIFAWEVAQGDRQEGLGIL